MNRGHPRQAMPVGLVEARRTIDASIPEADLQADVERYAALHRWRTYHTRDSRRSEPGFPDLVAVRGNQVVFAELKREGGRPTPAQEAWLADLRRVTEVTARLWMPSDWPEIEDVFGRRPNGWLTGSRDQACVGPPKAWGGPL